VELLLLVSFGLVAALLLHFVGDAAVDAVALAAIGLYVVGTTWWAVVSAFSGLAMFPKLAWIWLPAAAPLAFAGLGDKRRRDPRLRSSGRRRVSAAHSAHRPGLALRDWPAPLFDGSGRRDDR